VLINVEEAGVCDVVKREVVVVLDVVLRLLGVEVCEEVVEVCIEDVHTGADGGGCGAGVEVGAEDVHGGPGHRGAALWVV